MPSSGKLLDVSLPEVLVSREGLLLLDLRVEGEIGGDASHGNRANPPRAGA